MSDILTQNIQDYLKTIYELSEDGSTASTTAMATRMGIAPASVTGMLQKLASLAPPLVEYRKHQGVRLTLDGERAALEVIRHHRLLETYLVQTLGYGWDEVHEEACRLEHVISEDFERRIADILGHPERDPHGELIPSPDLIMPDDPSTALSNLRPGQTAIVLRVRASDSDFLRHIEGLGLIPGAHIKASDYSPFDYNLTLNINDSAPLVIGLGITSQIYIEIQ